MVVIGVGTDVVRVGRIGEVCKRWGNRFLARLLHPEEHARLQTSPPPHPDTVLRFIAGRWVFDVLTTTCWATSPQDQIINPNNTSRVANH
jgi:hypothetical protein